MGRKTRHELVEEVEHMLGFDTPARIAERLGLKPASIETACRREGRYDLSKVFSAAAWADRRAAGYVRPKRDRSRPDGARPRGQNANHDPGVRVAAGHDVTPARRPVKAPLAA